MLISLVSQYPNPNYRELAALSDQMVEREAKGGIKDDNDHNKMWRELIAVAKQATGRDCSGCNMCCYALNIEEPLHKPAGEMCKHCEVGKGCAIYADRPPVCSGYFCSWLTDDFFGPEWYPPLSKILIQYRHTGYGNKAYHFVLDPDFPERWREEPYYSTIMRVARLGLNDLNFHTYVVGPRTYFILPSKPVDVTECAHQPVRIGLGADDWDIVKFSDPVKGARELTGMHLAVQASQGMDHKMRYRLLVEMNKQRSRNSGGISAER